ncbi:unnamed protein product [Ilex paraguariensis]|uniref:Secreted protein n=1 Tax=Ilex paraguariensis TaxID=185542 RepID=A0ABC8SIE5_9AQUA
MATSSPVGWTLLTSFNLLSAICETAFHYQDKIPPSYYAVNVASNMQDIDIATAIVLQRKKLVGMDTICRRTWSI